MPVIDHDIHPDPVGLESGVLPVRPWPVAWVGWLTGLAAGLLGLLAAVQWMYYKKHL